MINRIILLYFFHSSAYKNNLKEDTESIAVIWMIESGAILYGANGHYTLLS